MVDYVTNSSRNSQFLKDEGVTLTQFIELIHEPTTYVKVTNT